MNLFCFLVLLSTSYSTIVTTSTSSSTPIAYKAKCNGCSFQGSNQTACQSNSFCQFKNNQCQPVLSCSSITKSDDCTAAIFSQTGLICKWQNNKCINIANTQCTSISGDSSQLCSLYGCGYVKGKYCSKGTKPASCNGIKDATCNLFQTNKGICLAQDDGSCLMYSLNCNNQTLSLVSNVPSIVPKAVNGTCNACGFFGKNQTACQDLGYCSWTNKKCKAYTECSKIQQIDSCNLARAHLIGLNCMWNELSGTCMDLKQSQCNSIMISSNQKQQCSVFGCGYVSGDFCSNPPKVTSCKSIKDGTCFLYQTAGSVCLTDESGSCTSMQPQCSK